MIWQNKIDDVDKWLHSNMAKIKGKINNRNGDFSIWYDNGEVFSLDKENLPDKNIIKNLNKPSPIMNIEEYTEGIKKDKTIIEEIGNENMDDIKEVIITVDDEQHSSNKHLLDDLTRILLDNEGGIPVSLIVKNNNDKVKLNLPFATVNASRSLEEKLDNIIGLENVYFKQ